MEGGNRLEIICALCRIHLVVYSRVKSVSSDLNLMLVSFLTGSNVYSRR